jgi:hypothetical protein
MAICILLCKYLRVIFKGNTSSYNLLKHQSYLNENIATWLHSTLKN